MFTSTFALGNFIGPTLSGIFYAQLGEGSEGFSRTTVITQGLILVTICLNIIAMTCRQQTSEYQSLARETDGLEE